ncbi:DnaJ subfamily B member 12 [Tetrabaena socialis]|uniref:DnaJ subfamily B member 12 n=1 Tax=Tetrabaena socialis TaxID=47790 RepID=A0A2J8AAM1_9CHLO|nr:DnaJ subfamily B member 12 [Tetrabaena socialis]|eukprot:PNH09562.1 DnaJ subfamily B member 12 [Tetrabaena socialis]
MSMDESSVANKDEARKCLAIARQLIGQGALQFDKAEKFIRKAQRLYASSEAQYLLETLEGQRAAATRQPATPSAQQERPHANGHARPTASPHQSEQQGPAGPTLPPRAARPAARPPAGAPATDPVRRVCVACGCPCIDPHHMTGFGLGWGLENRGTPEQRAQVAQVLRTKDFYEVLGLTKQATDDDIKKAYRKLEACDEVERLNEKLGMRSKQQSVF